MKLCSKCKTIKDDSDFYKNRARKDGLSCWCKSCGANAQRSYIKRNKHKHNAMHRKYNHRLKDLSFFAYGGYKCVECGEEREPCLTIDHINNDGARHRKLIGTSGQKIHRWLKKHNYPPGFQVLCRNCNWIKYHARSNLARQHSHRGISDEITYQKASCGSEWQ